ncbi:hypothetical protein ACFPOA_01900 [Lysobacter niabensis]|uniref:hypothetical protein n=1 Tax=Agrilutibacter niabensis TaxID=380628 RepID=UPI00361FA8D7
MKKKLAITGVVVLLAASAPSAADMFASSHSCHKPYKPYRFEDKWAVDRFSQEVEDYKQCIEKFVETQNDEAERHRQAAQGAIKEWNSYINYELR